MTSYSCEGELPSAKFTPAATLVQRTFIDHRGASALERLPNTVESKRAKEAEGTEERSGTSSSRDGVRSERRPPCIIDGFLHFNSFARNLCQMSVVFRKERKVLGDDNGSVVSFNCPLAIEMSEIKNAEELDGVKAN
uniref:Uncharacterized protein n=1 Tax=Steinernema glaseri TaxID=37863 RepID=A0A1I7ZBF7_9BILA